MINSSLLKYYIKIANTNQRELAGMLGIANNSFSRKMIGRTSFTVDEAAKLCHILNICDYAARVAIFLAYDN